MYGTLKWWRRSAYRRRQALGMSPGVKGRRQQLMKEKLTWAVVIFASMVLGGGVVIGADSLRDDSPSTTASPQVIERTVNAAGGVAMTAQQDVSELYARVKPS